MTYIIDEHLGRRIATARQSADMDAAATAAALELSVADYRALERGERRVSALIVARIARLYSLPIGWFYDGLPGQSAFIQVAKSRSI